MIMEGAPEKPTFLSRMMRHIVFGLEDGSVSTLGAVTGIAVGTRSGGVVILAGLVIIAVEALSMGAGAYLSSKSARKVYEGLVSKLHRALHAKPTVEKSHLVAYYQKCGLKKAEAEKVVAAMASDHKALLADLAAHEAQVSPDSYENAAESGGVMWLAYVIGGAVPLGFYLFLPPLTAIPWSVASTIVFLFLVGLGKARFTLEPPLRSGAEMVAISAAAAAIGFTVGQVADAILGISPSVV